MIVLYSHAWDRFELSVRLGKPIFLVWEQSMGSKQRLAQLLERAKVQTKFPRVKVDVIDARYIGELSGHGSGLYVRVPKEICDYFGLVAGDKVKIGIFQRKRWTDLEE